MNNNNNKRPADVLANRIIRNFQKDYFVIGKERIAAWPAWLIIGVITGVVIGLISVATRTGEFEKIEAVSFAGGQGQQAGASPRPEQIQFASDQLLIKLTNEANGKIKGNNPNDTGIASLNALHRTHKALAFEKLGRSGTGEFPWYLASFNLDKKTLTRGSQDSGIQNLQRIADAYSSDPNVEFVEFNYIVHTLLVPNDPQFSQLWGLNNTGQTGGTVDADIDAPEAWDITTGSSNIIVGVIDTGVDYNHPDLAANMWTNPGEIAGNGIDDDLNGYIDDIHGINAITNTGNPMDDQGHGTHVSGTIGGKGNNGIGVAGVNWNVRIAACKFLASNGFGDEVGAIKCFQYFNRLKKVQGQNVLLTSNSWGGGGFSQALKDAMAGLDQPGMTPILHAAAAGNSSNNNDASPTYPSSYDLDNIVAVAATDHKDLYASFSSYGATTVDLGAPGVNVLSSVPSGACSLCDPTGYKSISGTSMATPHVSGAAALVWSAYPGLTTSQMKQRILWSGDYIGNKGSNAAKPTLTNGRLNVFNALEDDTTPPAAVTNLSPSGSKLISVTLTWMATGDDGATGTAASYDIRYSTATPFDWDTATLAVGEPSPQPAGSIETFKVSGLSPGATYYFALKVRDNVGNESGLSNLATGSTTAGTTVFQDNMEGDKGAWSTSGLWNLDNYRSASPTHAWYYGQPATRNYNIEGMIHRGFLISGAINLAATTDAALVFYEWSQLEADNRFDRTRVQASADGTTWVTAFESHGTNNNWAKRAVDLTPYTGGNVYLRFYFDTMDQYLNNYEGWYVDDVVVFVAASGPDTTPPETTITSSPANPSNSSSATFGFTASEAGATFQCSLDGAAYTACISPIDYSGLADGTHTFQVKATDTVGNTDPTPASYTWTVDTTPPPDTTPPSTSISSPLNGATVSGTITVSVSATDTVGVTNVELLLDGAVAGADATLPYEFIWDTTQSPNGSHTLQSKAYDAAGNSSSSSIITVTVSNTVSDTTPPSVSITFPLNNSTVATKSTVSIGAKATDNVGVFKVEFYVNAFLRCTDVTAPYSCSWKVPGAFGKTYQLQSKAYDTSNNIGSSAVVTVKSQ